MKKILIVEDDLLIIDLLKQNLRQADFSLDTATTAEIALIKMSNLRYDVILVDIQLPGISGLDLCKKIKKSLNSTARIICMSGNPSQETIVNCYGSGAINFLHKPFTREELIAVVKVAAFEIRYVNDIESHIEALLKALEAKDFYTSGHSENVAQISCSIGKEIGLNDKELYYLRIGCLIHDLGKIGIRDEILNKPGKLSDLEFQEIKRHPIQFQSIVKSVPISADALEGAADHHERFDGSGYPLGKKGDEIHPWGKIMAIADVYDALTSERAYKAPWKHWDAVHEINRQKGKHFDPEYIEIFLDLCRKNSPNFFLSP